MRWAFSANIADRRIGSWPIPARTRRHAFEPPNQADVTPITIRVLLARNHFRFCQSPRRAAIPLPDLDDPSDCREPGGGSSGSGDLGRACTGPAEPLLVMDVARCEPQPIIALFTQWFKRRLGACDDRLVAGGSGRRRSRSRRTNC